MTEIFYVMVRLADSKPSSLVLIPGHFSFFFLKIFFCWILSLDQNYEKLDRDQLDQASAKRIFPNC